MNFRRFFLFLVAWVLWILIGSTTTSTAQAKGVESHGQVLLTFGHTVGEYQLSERPSRRSSRPVPPSAGSTGPGFSRENLGLFLFKDFHQ